MDNIILGLLLLKNRTIYELRERIEKGLNLMYSSSTGSIQAAIKKLMSLGLIDYKEAVDGGKRKKIYSITGKGRQTFIEWVNAPMDEQRPKSPELVKIYFLGFSDKENREKIVAEHIDFLNRQYLTLKAICEDSKNIKVPQKDKDIFDYQLASAFYGKELIEFNINWYKSLLDKIRGEEYGSKEA